MGTRVAPHTWAVVGAAATAGAFHGLRTWPAYWPKQTRRRLLRVGGGLDGDGALRLSHHGGQLRDHLERLAGVHQALQLPLLLLDPRRLDRPQRCLTALSE